MAPREAGGKNGRRKLPTAGREDVVFDPRTADAEDQEAAARAQAADRRQRGG
ncbi:YfhD family protein [Thermobacillus sp. ZCTH02-B1]|uniref:YfhD family protein n=1 Tax=Thermobacillus sp. ZCTH02-B1 TaxID=1858795 RepID=UPI0025E56A10|nr:YfhD family protein [Thermobacillus sp. ZCTH02-B1]